MAAINLELATSVLSYLTLLTRHIYINALISSFSWLILSARSGIGKFSGSFLSKYWDQPGWFLIIKSGSSLKLGIDDSPKVCFEKAKILSQAFSSIKLNWFPWGLGLAVLISYPAPALRKAPTSAPVNFLAVISILKQIIRRKVILSFSKRPLLICLWTCLVITLIMKSTLFWGELASGDFCASDQLKRSKNCSRELLYIQLIKKSSIRVK